MKNNVETACNITEEIYEKLKKIIHSPMTYTELEEDGSRTLANTEFGQSIYDSIYDSVKNYLDNE